jgi:hypothetical protein
VIRLLKIKNPFKRGDNNLTGKVSNTDWSGRFGLSDKFWNVANKAAADFDKLDENEFFMSVEDFRESFKHYTVTYLHSEWKKSFIEKRNALNKKSYRFNFTITDEHVSSVKSTSAISVKTATKADKKTQPVSPTASPAPPKVTKNEVSTPDAAAAVGDAKSPAPAVTKKVDEKKADAPAPATAPAPAAPAADAAPAKAALE